MTSCPFLFLGLLLVPGCFCLENKADSLDDAQRLEDAQCLVQATLAHEHRQRNVMWGSGKKQFRLFTLLRGGIRRVVNMLRGLRRRRTSAEYGEDAIKNGFNLFESSTMVEGLLLMTDGFRAFVKGRFEQTSFSDAMERYMVGLLRLVEGSFKFICMGSQIMSHRVAPMGMFTFVKRLCIRRSTRMMKAGQLGDGTESRVVDKELSTLLQTEMKPLYDETEKSLEHYKDLLWPSSDRGNPAGGSPSAAAFFAMKRKKLGAAEQKMKDEILAPLRDQVAFIKSNSTSGAADLVDEERLEEREQLEEKGWTTHWTGEMLPPGWTKSWSNDRFEYTNSAGEELHKDAWYAELAKAEHRSESLRWNSGDMCYEYFDSAKSQFSCELQNDEPLN